MAKGLIRLLAVLGIGWLLLSFLSLRDFDSLLDTVIKLFPFGSKIKTIALQIFEKGAGDYDYEGALNWFIEETVSSTQGFLECSRLFFVGAFLSAVKKNLRRWLPDSETGILNWLADFLFFNLALVVAVLVSSWVYDFFMEQLIKLPDATQDIVSLVVGAGGFLGALIGLAFGGAFIPSLLKCLWKIIAAVLVYMLCCIIAFSNAPMSVTVAIAVVFMAIFFFIDRLFDAI